MRRFRLAVATLVAVALLTVGSAACTPEQQAAVGAGVGAFFSLVWVRFLLQATGQCPTFNGGPCVDFG